MTAPSASAHRCPRRLRIAVLVKQVPGSESLVLGEDGRLERTGHDLEMNPYCRRAVAKGIELARASKGQCTVVTLGPPSAEECLREAVACGAANGVLVSDPAFAGSDTLATARALGAALRRLGRFDLVLCGRNSVDSETGQLPAQLAELLDLPLASGVRALTIGSEQLAVVCEHDDGWLTADVSMPAVLSCAERLTTPAKAGPTERAAVPAARISHLRMPALGAGPWGDAGSMTSVGATRRPGAPRLRLRWHGDVADQVSRAMAALAELGVFDPAAEPSRPPVPDPGPVRARRVGGDVVVVAEPGRDQLTRELLGRAALLGATVGRRVTVLASAPLSPHTVGSWGADTLTTVTGSDVEEDIADGLGTWCARHRPWAVLAPATMWGREIAGRAAARLGAGLVGDAVDVTSEVRQGTGAELVCWKPALHGAVVAEVTCRSAIRFVTVRPGVLPLSPPRVAIAASGPDVVVAPRGRVRVHARQRDDDIQALALARVVVGVGAGVHQADYPLLDPLLTALGAELAATRRVTDRGWQPRSRQVGVTGRSITPRLYVAIGTSGGSNHLIGARGAGVILGINDDPDSALFDSVDVGICADWCAVVTHLVGHLTGIGRTTAPRQLLGGHTR